MKVMHLTWGETPRSYGVFGSQVIAQFVATRRATPEAQFLFVSGLPIIHSGMIREKFKYIDECRKVQDALGDINFHLVPIYAPQNFINSSATTFRWLHGPAHWYLNSLIKKFNPNVIHCRSYHAAWAALSVRKNRKLNYRIVFDGRGLYPEEVALKNSYNNNNENYKYLKRIELELLTECDVSIAVSDPMRKHYYSLGVKDCRTVYLGADSDRLKPTQLIYPISDSVNFCYVGALSEETWHKTSELLKLFRRLRELIPNAQLTIVTTSDHQAVRRYFTEFTEDVVQIKESRTLSDLKSFMQRADFGLMTYFEPKTVREVMLADMVLAVKTAEYLCSGLPMIVNRYCGGAAEIIKKYDMGIIYDPGDLDSIKAESIIGNIPDVERKKNIALKAKELFDYDKNAAVYSKIYAELC